MNVGCIVLAAGGSRRLGAPKQLLQYRGQSLLRRAAATALAAGCQRVIVVLGSGAATLAAELSGLDVRTVVNVDWERGLGGSVRLGMAALAVEGEFDSVLLTLCDQPLIEVVDLQALLEAWADREPSALVAAAYDDTLGVPALFGRAHFGELAALPDAAGAKAILQRHASRVIAVPMPAAAVDIDTRAQYERLAGGR